MRRRWWTPTLPAWALVLAAMIAVTATPARAALWLEFRPAAASPGVAVHAQTGGQAAMADIPNVGLPLVLIPAAQADRLPRTVSTAAALRTLPGVVPVGMLQIDQQGNGTITFTVPRLPPGRYAAMLWCPACARHSFGTNVAYTGGVHCDQEAAAVNGDDLGVAGQRGAWPAAGRWRTAGR
jgi:hypothetical protein